MSALVFQRDKGADTVPIPAQTGEPAYMFEAVPAFVPELQVCFAGQPGEQLAEYFRRPPDNPIEVQDFASAG